MPIKESLWKKYIGIIKDISLILGIIITGGGWIRSSAIKETNTKNKFEVLTTSVNDATEQLKKINTILMEQQTLNGKIIFYMEHYDN